MELGDIGEIVQSGKEIADALKDGKLSAAETVTLLDELGDILKAAAGRLRNLGIGQ